MKRAFGVLLLLFVIAVSVGSGSLFAPTCEIESNGKHYEENKKTNEKCPSLDAIIFFRGVDGAFWINDFIRTYREDINAYSTIVIAIFTAILGGFTIALSGSTRIAANAAKESAEAAVAAERARFYVSINEYNFMNFMNAIEHWVGGDDANAHLPDVPYAKVFFDHFGKTPGVVQVVCCRLEYSTEPVVPKWIIKEEPQRMIPVGESIGPYVCSGDQLTRREARAIYDGQAGLWLYGRLYYLDVFGAKQLHGFYKRFGRSGQFKFGLSDYKYRDYNRST